MKKVICGKCREHVWNYKYDDYIAKKIAEPEDFEGANGYSNPDRTTPRACPNCGNKFITPHEDKDIIVLDSTL